MSLTCTISAKCFIYSRKVTPFVSMYMYTVSMLRPTFEQVCFARGAFSNKAIEAFRAKRFKSFSLVIGNPSYVHLVSLS